MILRALSKASANVMAVGIFIGMQWLSFAILTTSLIRKKASEQDDSWQLKEPMLKHFSSVPRSFLTALEATVGGVDWGQLLITPCFNTKRPFWIGVGISLLVLVLFSTFCLWNLVLGIFVRQVISIGKDLDKELDNRDYLQSEDTVHHLRAILEQADDTNDGFVDIAELQAVLFSDSEFFDIGNGAGISADEMEILFNALDHEELGKVDISKILFALIKLSKSSKAIDMLSIDYLQKVFLGDLGLLEATALKELGEMSKEVDLMVQNTRDLKLSLHELQNGINMSKLDIQHNIAKEDAAIDAINRQVAEAVELEQAQLQSFQQKAREHIEDYVGFLKAETEEASRARFLENLSQGASPEDLAALRLALRRQLQCHVSPWLRMELSEAGGLT